MESSREIEAVNEWNRLSRENVENAIASSMFEASSNSVEPIDKFATWLLVGAAAVASFLLGNADKLVPIIGKSGFLSCGLLLCLSCLFGVLSKFFALLGQIGLATGTAVKDSMLTRLQQHEETARQIEKRASELGVAVETGVRIERILNEFVAPLPWWARWAVRRNIAKHAGNPQVGYLPRIKNLNRQGVSTFFQALTFLLFLVFGFVSAAAI